MTIAAILGGILGFEREHAGVIVKPSNTEVFFFLAQLMFFARFSRFFCLLNSA